MFNSNNRTEVEIGFRLGGYEEKCKGTAWFSDFSIEAGSTDEDNNWNVACFILENIDADVEGLGNVKQTVSFNDVKIIRDDMKRFQDSIKGLSNNKIFITYDVIEITEPVTTLSHNDDNGYYISPGDVKNVIDVYLNREEYDYIFVVAQLGNINDSETNLHNWIGLGAIEYNQIGFANIRLPKDNSAVYQYSSTNTFPEEVFVHEFLHTLERNENDNGNDVISLHDYAKYGYKENGIDGLREWYRDYLQNTIKGGDSNGLTDFAYSSKPIQNSNFEYSISLNYFDEPQNIIGEIKSILSRVGKLFKK